ncbi:MobA/MobL family protein [Kordiimonas gwangyangensis]|uniref:MobA/MobL family protein n=1 Tax=Kordiimonas gwangyangensis TaxID=288022 RepID=UPI000381E7F6|nr:MobA/MobL family protein [Kordiimonas gwangyangensis]
MHSDEEPKRRGYVQEPERKMRLVSGRIGPKGRTFHLKIASATKAAPTGKGASVDYIARIGDYSHKDTDFESAAGRDPEEMREILDAVHNTTKRKNGRIAIPITMELPNDLSATARQQIAARLCAYFEGEGYPAMAVVHGNGKVQPHLHLLTTGRPVSAVAASSPNHACTQHGDWLIANEGTRGNAQRKRLFADRTQVKLFRRHVAARIINEVLEENGLEGNWHGGTLKETGLDREPKKRIRERDWADGRRTRNEVAASLYHAKQECRREAAKRDQEARAQAKSEKLSYLRIAAANASQYRVEMAKARGKARKHLKTVNELAEALQSTQDKLSAATQALDAAKRLEQPSSRPEMTREAREMVQDLLIASGRDPAHFAGDFMNGGSPELWSFVRASLKLKKAEKDAGQSAHSPDRSAQPTSVSPLKARDLAQAYEAINGMDADEVRRCHHATKAKLDMLGNSVSDQLERQGLKIGLQALHSKLPGQANKAPTKDRSAER